jgi:beta-phosphoglucomutase
MSKRMAQNIIDINTIEKAIKADSILFFDMDGTLVDTNLANFLAYLNAIQKVTNSDHGLRYDPNIRFNRSTLKSVIQNLAPIDYDNIIQEKELFYDDLLCETTLNKIISQILFKYSKTNKTVLVTNCRTERANATLKFHSLSEKFDHIFYRQFSENEEKINKYQFAISSLEIAPQKIIVFENEDPEIDDALFAGIPKTNIFKT